MEEEKKEKCNCENCECEQNHKENTEIVKEINTDYKDIAARALADLDNYRKRIEEENKEFRKMATFNVISEFLDIYNNLKQAEGYIPEDQKSLGWVKGITMIANQFRERFSQFGIEEFSCLGKKFDHNTMDAILTDKDESQENDIVLKEINSGFKMGDKVVQHAKVVVNKI